MDRKKFLTDSFRSLGTIIALPTAITACSDDDGTEPSTLANGGGDNTGDRLVSPAETVGPFPIRTPAQYVRASIIGDRTGVPLLMTLTIQDQSNGCTPLADVLVDVWQCDKEGNYSQYGGNQLQASNYSNQNFLRGRQTTDANEQVLFISILVSGHRIYMLKCSQQVVPLVNNTDCFSCFGIYGCLRNQWLPW